MESNEKEKWREAMIQENNSHKINGTWELVEESKIPKDRNIVKSKWIYKIKQDGEGNIDKYKARLVAQGFTQEEGVDYNETYSPVTKMTTIRSLLAISALKSWTIHQSDFATAYLNSEISEEIYMEQPEGFETRSESGERLVCRLRRSIYGLKQAGRNWNELLTKWLIDYGFTQSKVDPCVFTLVQGQNILVLCIYVDDMLSSSNNDKFREKVLDDLGKRFKLTNFGQISWILSIRVEMKEDRITLNQEKYIVETLRKLGMENCKPVGTPMATPRSQRRAVQDDENGETEPKLTDKKFFLQIMGSLTYISVVSRPDIAYSVGKLSQHNQNPTEEDLIAAKRVLRYLQGTKDFKITFWKDEEDELYGHADADWAGDLDTRRSTTGYVFLLAGSAISWNSKRQHTIALSSTEAEYMAVCAAAQEAIHLRKLLKDLLIEDKGPVTIFQDNKAAIAMANNQMTTKRSKHIDVKYHFIREQVRRGQIQLKYIKTQKMIADMFTKALPQPAIERCLNYFFG